MIQWEINGVLQFATPKKVTRVIRSQQHGEYVMVEGSQTAIPREQIVHAVRA